jgi:hypothetical protein
MHALLFGLQELPVLIAGRLLHVWCAEGSSHSLHMHVFCIYWHF